MAKNVKTFFQTYTNLQQIPPPHPGTFPAIFSGTSFAHTSGPITLLQDTAISNLGYHQKKIHMYFLQCHLRALVFTLFHSCLYMYVGETGNSVRQ